MTFPTFAVAAAPEPPAPVTVGAGALVAAGSVVTKEVPPDAVAIARPEQVNKPGAAAKFRARKAAEKAAKAVK